MTHDLGTYVYLATLEDIDPEFAMEAREYSTFKPYNAVNNKGQAIQPILNAISILTNIANTQAQLEHQAIKNYIQKLDKYISDESCPKALRDKLTIQKDKLNAHNLDFTGFKSNQFDLINAINLIQQDLNTYVKRLNQITTPTTIKEVKARLPYNLQILTEKFLLNQNKKKQRRKNVKRDQKLKSMIHSEISSKIRNIPANFIQELDTLIFIDFNNWLDNNQDKTYSKLTEDDIEELFLSYNKLSGHAGEETHLQKILRSSHDELMVLLNDLQGNIHSTYLTPEEYDKITRFVNESNKNKLLNDSETKSSKSVYVNGKSYSLRQAKALIETYNADLDNIENRRYAFTFHTATSHGNFWEFFQTVIQSAANVSGNVGADLIIPIGTITYGEENEQNQQRLLKLSRNLGELITENFNEQDTITIENFNNQVKNQTKLSKTLQNAIKNREKTLTKMGELNEDFFIAHESLKLYRQSEEKDSEIEEFHGRKMNALSALAKLYASPLLSKNLIRSDLLITFLLNISDVTLAHNQAPLETYLSLFAGLLMFDDIRALAETGVKQISSNLETATIHSLHVYNIDGVYLPISVILNNLIDQMNGVLQGFSSLNSTGTAVAVIEGPTPTIPSQGSMTWEDLANNTIQNTKIQIHFLKGYTDYISQLFSNLSG